MSLNRVQKQIVNEYQCPIDGETLKDDSLAAHYRIFSDNHALM